MLPDGIVIVDHYGRIRHINHHLLTLSGFSAADLVGHEIEVLIPERLRPMHETDRAKYSERPTTREMNGPFSFVLAHHDGSEISVDVALAPISVDGHDWIIAEVRSTGESGSEGARPYNIQQLGGAAMVSVAVALAQSEERFRLAFENNMAPMIFTDLEDRVFMANDAFCSLIGRTRDELIGFDSVPFTHPDDVGIAENSLRSATLGEEGQSLYVKRYVHKDGRVIVVEVSRSPVRDSEGNILHFVISERDVTDRVKRDHMMQLLSEVNRLAIQAIDEAEFLQQLCDLLVSQGNYELVWVGVAAGAGANGIDILCSAGATEYLFGEMASWWGSSESGFGPTGTAIRSGNSSIINDLTHHSVNEAWGERARQFGFGSFVAIPGQFGERVAVLAIYDRHTLTFDEMTVKGLEGIVREAQFAVAHVRSVHDTEAALEETTVAIENLIMTERALTESEQRFRLAFEDNMAPMIFVDLNERVIAANDAFCEMIGRTREEVLQGDVNQFTHRDDVDALAEAPRRVANSHGQMHYSKRYVHKDGRQIIVDVSKSPARDDSGKTLYFIIFERDVTEERALTAQIRHQALHDPLTGLANRALFEDRLSQALARVARSGGMGAVLLLDLDDFKGVNDTHGHLVGDQLLQGVARRFELVTRATDTLSRFGGDEFLYLAEGIASANEAADVAIRLLDVLETPFTFHGVHLNQHASVGIVVWDETNADSTEFIQNVDVALYEAKRGHRGNYAFFTPSMHQKAIGHFALAQDLRQSLQQGDLTMHYQPIVNLETSVVVGFEALMRWHHPERGWVPPTVFIPIAEQSQLILDLGSFALHDAVSVASSWRDPNPDVDPPYVTVNLSAHQFQNPELLPLIKRSLNLSGLSPGRLILEITEQVALGDVTETLSVIRSLNELGIGIALDDFGTGFSSLSYLTRLNPRIIKVDRSFVSPQIESAQNDTLLEMIVALGNRLELTMLAEGIETVAQLERLQSLNCELGQGFLYSAAVPADDTMALVGHTFLY